MARENTARGRYGERTASDGRLLIYDTTNEDAWLKSDTSVGIAWRT